MVLSYWLISFFFFPSFFPRSEDFQICEENQNLVVKCKTRFSSIGFKSCQKSDFTVLSVAVFFFFVVTECGY